MISLKRLDGYMMSKELVDESVGRREGCGGLMTMELTLPATLYASTKATKRRGFRSKTRPGNGTRRLVSYSTTLPPPRRYPRPIPLQPPHIRKSLSSSHPTRPRTRIRHPRRPRLIPHPPRQTHPLPLPLSFPLPHSHLLYLAFNSLALAKLRRYPDALRDLDDLDSPSYRFESYPDTYPGMAGSFVPFGLRLMRCLLPAKLGKKGETIDRLYELLGFVRERIEDGGDGSGWRRREEFVIGSIVRLSFGSEGVFAVCGFD
ncbi:hypothetical protein Droror1_Dr00028002 [Drosera rotundifolia]